MAFAVNHSQASQGKYLPPEGTYEVIIDKAEEKTTTMSGKRLINFAFVIRQDVVQNEQGQVFEYGMFPLNKPTANDPEGYRLGTIQMICKCIGIPEGMNFNSLSDWLEAITQMPIKVEIKHREYNGQDQINVNYLPTEFPQVNAGLTVNPDDLPF